MSDKMVLISILRNARLRGNDALEPTAVAAKFDELALNLTLANSPRLKPEGPFTTDM